MTNGTQPGASSLRVLTRSRVVLVIGPTRLRPQGSMPSTARRKDGRHPLPAALPNQRWDLEPVARFPVLDEDDTKG